MPSSKKSKVSPKHWPSFVLICMVCFAILGCQNTASTGDRSADRAVTAKPNLRVVVVDDEKMGLAVERRWISEGNEALKIIPMTTTQLVQDKFQLAADIDVIVTPVNLFGDLFAAEQFLQIDMKLINDEVLTKDNILSHFRGNLTRFDNADYVFPMGGPQFVLLYRRDKIQSPPTTWTELSELIRTLPAQGAESESSSVLIEPLADEWAAHSFLARVAPYIRTRGKISTVFDLESMQPLVESEPFIKALSEMVADHQNPASRQAYSPKEVFKKFLAGETLMAVTWPTSFGDTNTGKNFDVGVARIPGSDSWFDYTKKEWIERAVDVQKHYDYLGFEGRAVGVAKNSINAGDSMRFAAWLSSNQASQKISPESIATGPFRVSQLGTVGLWTQDSLPDSAIAAYSEVIRATHKDRLCFAFPRIAKRSEYLNVLAEAVRRSIDGTMAPNIALKQVSDRWKELNEQIGIQQQLGLLRKSEGF